MKKLNLILSAVVITTIMLSSCRGGASKEVTIGKQVWMTENLNVDKFRNGDPIPEAKTGVEWILATNRLQPAWCYYDNDPENGKKYGKLYNWYVASDSRNVCPDGWRVSTDQDWTILQEFLGDKPGDKLKKTGTDEWNFPNSGALDEFGFSAVPSGVRDNEGFFNGIGINSVFWSPSSSIAYFRFITVNNDIIGRTTRSKTNGLCIRCVKN